MKIVPALMENLFSKTNFSVPRYQTKHKRLFDERIFVLL